MYGNEELKVTRRQMLTGIFGTAAVPATASAEDDRFGFRRGIGSRIASMSGGTGGAKRKDWRLGFTALEDGCTVAMEAVESTYVKAPAVSLLWSFDGYRWNDFVVGETVVQLANQGDSVWLKANTPNASFTNVGSAYNHFVLSGRISASGSVMSLLNGNDRMPRMDWFCFAHLFQDCETLVTPPSVPATYLSTGCYQRMFQGCTSLEEMPDLPATTLFQHCYQYMFLGCTSLKKAKPLTLQSMRSDASYCCNGMFYECRGLTEAGDLHVPAMTTSCFDNMFYNCSSLQKSPKITADSAAANSCKEMFYGCVGMTSAGKIHVSRMADSCFDSAFQGCANLVESPVIDTSELSASCFLNMFDGCTSLTVARIPAPMALAESCYRGMFYGCSALERAPDLSGNVLAKNCFANMFQWCSNLKVAPALPYSTLAEGCYSGMFARTGLSEMPDLPATVLAPSCYKGMFSSCGSLVAAKPLRATTLAANCYDSMFDSCGNLTVAPKIYAETLTSTSFIRMFRYCRKLSRVETNQNSFDGCTSWLGYVPASGKFYCTTDLKLKLTDGTYVRGENTVPSGWTVYDRMFTGLSFTFSAEGMSLSFVKHGSPDPISLEYSTDEGETWSAWTETDGVRSFTATSANQKLCLRGTNDAISKSADDYYQFGTSGSGTISAEGYAASILDPSATTAAAKVYGFAKLFSGMTALTTAPALPYSTLAEGCYFETFAGCSNLANPPTLLATALTASCYRGMFKGCSKMAYAPELPVVTLADSCYREMFMGCTTIAASPVLGATTMQPSCYRDMFNGCTSLATPPTLASVSLADSCYRGMFSGCEVLASVPVLAATILAASCYREMFKGCIAIEMVDELPATTLADSCYAEMFSGCMSLAYVKTEQSDFTGCTDWLPDTNGTFRGVPSLVDKLIDGTYSRSSSTVPSTWTLTDGRYKGLAFTFASAGTTLTLSKTGTPTDRSLEYSTDEGANWALWTETDGVRSFTATEAGQRLCLCGDNYSFSTDTYSFYTFSLDGAAAASGDLRSVIDKSMTLTSIRDECFYSLFRNCSFLTSGPELNAGSVGAYSYGYMFYGCSGLVKAPALPAATLSRPYCYSSMFRGCTALTDPPEMSAGNYTIGCFSYMFQGCKNLKSAPSIPSGSMQQYSCQYMFANCIKLTSAPVFAATATQYSYSCQHMFDGCESLETAPELPTTSLFGGCYRYMFQNCTALKTVPLLGASILPDPGKTFNNGCYYSMFYGCTNLESLTTKQRSFNGCINWLVGTGGTISTGRNFHCRDTLKAAIESGTYTRGTGTVPNAWTLVGDVSD